jgi:hypothetical protein
MTPEEIEAHQNFAPALRRQAAALLAMHDADPRASAVFATQQSWLLAHLALSMYFLSRTVGQSEDFRLTSFLAAVAAHGIASRNTADAFIKGMENYGYLEATPGSADRRIRPLTATAAALRPFEAWLMVHLATLDALDDGERLARFASRPEGIAYMQPQIAEGLLRSAAVREPAPTFSLFTWLNEGGFMMDWIYAGLGEAAPGADRLPTTVTSYADFSSRIRLSKSHLARKLRAAEDMGSLSWAGVRGASAMSVSTRFVREYHTQQAAKLSVIDDAFAYAVDHGRV